MDNGLEKSNEILNLKENRRTPPTIQCPDVEIQIFYGIVENKNQKT